MRVMVFGTFDILHPGHINFFKQARAYGTELYVVVARDSTVQRIKHKLPRHTEEQRLAAVRAEPLVMKAILGSAVDPMAVIYENTPDVVCLGYDQDHIFVHKLYSEFPNLSVVRLTSYKPEHYKSSLLH